MKIEPLTVWWYTIKFLEYFNKLVYDFIPLNILLLRDFQKFIINNYSKIPKPDLKNFQLQNIQAECEQYLQSKTPISVDDGYILVRANLLSITGGVDDRKFIYLAHHKKEQLKMKKCTGDKLFYYIHDLPEATIPKDNENQLYSELERLLMDKSIALFKKKSFIKWLNREIAIRLVLIRKAKHLFDTYPIKQVFYGSTINKHGALITTIAKTRQIPTINLQHGILGELGHLPVNADLNLVWGKPDSDFLVNHGADIDRLIIVGPFFLQSSINSTKKNIEKKPNQSEKKLNILVALQPLGSNFNKRMIEKIEKASQDVSENIIVKYKLHPDQTKYKKYKGYLIRNNSYIIVHNKEPLYNLISEADLVITPFSTVGLEALILNVPVAFYGEEQTFYYLSGEVPHIYETTKIGELLQKGLTDPNYLTLLKEKVNLRDNYQQIYNRQQLWEIIDQNFKFNKPN